MNKVMNFARSTAGRVAAFVTAAVVAGASVVGIGGAAGAVTLEEQFTSTQTSLLQEFGYGAALLIAILLFVVGITVLVKWARKGSKMSA